MLIVHKSVQHPHENKFLDRFLFRKTSRTNSVLKVDVMEELMSTGVIHPDHI